MERGEKYIIDVRVRLRTGEEYQHLLTQPCTSGSDAELFQLMNVQSSKKFMKKSKYVLIGTHYKDGFVESVCELYVNLPMPQGIRNIERQGITKKF